MLGYTSFVHQNVSLQQGRIETSTNYVWTKLLQDAFSDWKVLFLLSFPLDNANILLIIVSLWKPGFFSSSLDKRRFFIHDFLTASKKNWTSAAAPPPLSNHQTAPTCRQASLPNLANTRQKNNFTGTVQTRACTSSYSALSHPPRERPPKCGKKSQARYNGFLLAAVWQAAALSEALLGADVYCSRPTYFLQASHPARPAGFASDWQSAPQASVCGMLFPRNKGVELCLGSNG